MNKLIGVSAFIVLLAVSCTKDRILPPASTPNPTDTIIGPGSLFINEYLAAGNGFLNEFGVASDWIEIYNPSNSTFTLETGKWFITDAAASTPDKFALPQVSIPANGFLVIWCDNMAGTPGATQIHTNFALSSAGENLGLFYRPQSDFIQIDQRQYGPQQSNVSEGRSPDGAPQWANFTNPTPGASNN